MADQVFTVALDDKGFASGLSRMERQNKLVSDRVDAAWNRQGKSFEGRWQANAAAVAKVSTRIGASSAAGFALAQRAVKAYADEFPGAASGAEHLEGAMHDLMVNLGRDLEESGVARGLASIVGWLDKMRTSAVSGLAEVFSAFHGEGESVADLDAAQREIESQEQRKRLMAETLDLQIAQAEAEGRLADATDLRAQKQVRADQERISGLAKHLSSNDPAVLAARNSVTAAAAARKAKRASDLDTEAQDQADEIAADAAEASGDTLGAKNIREGIRLRKQMRGFDQLQAQGVDTSGLRSAAQAASQANRVRIASEEESPAVRAFKADQARQKAAGAQSAELSQAAELRRIEQLSLEGHEKEAALARVRLDYARQRAEIEEKDLVTAEEKARLLDELGGQEAMALKVTGEGFDRKKSGGDVRTLGAGLGASAAQVFGVGGKTPARDHLTEAKKQTTLLREIKDKVGGGLYF